MDLEAKINALSATLETIKASIALLKDGEGANDERAFCNLLVDSISIDQTGILSLHIIQSANCLLKLSGRKWTPKNFLFVHGSRARGC